MGLRFSKGTSEEQVDLTQNKNWKDFVEGYFDSVDANKNGYVVIEEILKWPDSIQEEFEVTPEEAKKLRESLKEFFGAVGLVPGKQVNKQEFVDGVNRLAQSELKKKKQGEETLHHKLSEAFYEVIDINNDGTIGLGELTKMMRACNMDESNSETVFKKADKNENGKVERKELADIEFALWFLPTEDHE